MAANRWSIRNYNTYVREMRTLQKLTYREAQAAYRVAKERLGRSLTGADVKRHPRITKESAAIAKREVYRRQKRDEGIQGEYSSGIGGGSVSGPSADPVDRWEEVWSSVYEYDDQEYASSADYEEN